MNENVVDIEVIEHPNRLTLSKPIMIDGEEKKYIDYNTDNLTGGSIEKAIQELAKRQVFILSPEIDTVLHAQLFAFASGLDYLDINRLSMKDYAKATAIIRAFFIN